MDIKKELQVRLDYLLNKIKEGHITNTKPYRIYFRGFAAGRIRQYMNEVYFLQGLLDKLDNSVFQVDGEW